MVPLIQRHLDEFKDLIWNTHRIRHQKDTYMADGVPNHMYDFPAKYRMEQCGMYSSVPNCREGVILQFLKFFNPKITLIWPPFYDFFAKKGKNLHFLRGFLSKSPKNHLIMTPPNYFMNFLWSVGPLLIRPPYN